MNKLIGLYIILILLIALFALFDVNFYPAFLIKVPFTPFIHKTFEGLVTFIFILIFWKANQLYSQTKDKRMAIIAGSFLAASFLNIYHLMSSFGILLNVLTFENIKINPALIYLLAIKLIIPGSLFIAIFYTEKVSDQNLKDFRRKTYFLYFCIFLSIIIWNKFIFYWVPDFIVHKILLIEHNLSIIDESLYFLISLFLIDRNLAYGKKMFSVFIAGLFLLGSSELFDVNPTFLAINEIFSHFFKALGFLFIFFGITKFQSLPDIKSIKQKMLTSLALFLIISYLTFSFFISLISESNLSLNLPYIFIEFLLISAIIGYIVTSSFISPISNIIETMNKYKPGKKSEQIKINSNDEIGELSKKLNEIIDREWDYSQELMKNQAKIQNLLDKEHLLFKITTTIRSSLNINETLSIIGNEIATVFNVQRASIVKFPDKNDYKKWIVQKEFKSYEKIKGFADVEFDIKVGEYNGIFVVDKGQNLVINNLQESDTPDYYKKTYTKMGIKSILSVPIRTDEDKWGLIFLSEYEYYREWTKDEITLLQTIADQIYIAIKQSELFETVKQTADREKLLRQIIETIRNTLDIKKVKKSIVKEMGKVFNADRCYFRAFNKKTDKFLPPDVEYLASPDIKSLMNIEPDQEGLIYFADALKKHEKGFYPIVVDIDTIKDPLVERYMKNAGILVDYAIPMWDKEEELTYLVLHYSTRRPNLQKEDLNLMETIAKQIIIAMDQVKLYETIKEQSKKEVLLRKIIETIRGTLDIEYIKKELVNQIGMFLKADRVAIAEYDSQIENYIVSTNAEYRSSENIKTFVGVDFTNIPGFIESIKNVHLKKNDIIFNNLEKYLDENNLKGTAVEKFYTKYGFISSMAINIYYRNLFLGDLVITFEHQKDFLEDEISLIKTLANQAGVAIHQAKLYETIKKQAQNERILREIISEIKISQTLDEIYKYIIKKLADVFDTERALFIEMPELENENPSIKHQYHKQLDIPFIPEYMIQEKCLMDLFETANKEGVAIVSNTQEHNKDDEKLQHFFKSFNIKSILLVPLIRYNHDIKLLGAFVLCSSQVRDWNQDEINLIKSLTNSTVTVIWEIKKRAELEELRDVFILTLTHDLQVPLVGEHKALEFIVSRSEDQPIGKFKDIIIDILKNNEGLTILLKKLLNTYNFESGKQKLDLSLQNLNVPINNVINSLKDLADSKQISIETQIDENLPSIMMDSEQIKNILHTLLENSITYIQQGGHIIIKSIKEKDKIITSVTDNGPGIPYQTRERIFERYAMAIAIERKIGAGLGLYLAKQIIEAHRGRIWFETELGKGTTFYFSLPLG